MLTRPPRRNRLFSRSTLRVILFALAAYGAGCLFLMASETRLLFLPAPGPTDPAQAGLASYQADQFTAADGAIIPLWEHATQQGPILLYFHGNGGGLYMFTPPLQWFAEQKLHVRAMEYRGYPGAPDKPTETGLVNDAIALYDATRARYPDRPILVWGYSLGSGVAVQLAAARPLAGLILEAPFTSTVDRAAELFPLFPVKHLMTNQFRSITFIDQIHTPLLILHGERDAIVPLHHGKALYARAHQPKTMRTYAGAGHLDLLDTQAYGEALLWLKHLISAPEPR